MAGSQWVLYLLVVVSSCLLSDCTVSGEPVTSGFISLDRLLGLGQFPSIVTHGQSLYPSFGFTCRGNITEWIVMGRRIGNPFAENVPYLQTWRKAGKAGTYVRVSSTPLEFGVLGTDSDEIGIYHYPVDLPVEFQAGDIIGMFEAETGAQFRVFTLYGGFGSTAEFFYTPAGSAVEPTARVFNTTDEAVVTSDDVPLVTVSTTAPECTTGFPSLEKLKASEDKFLRGALRGNRVSAAQVVLPRLNFTCDGNITKWIVAGALNFQNSLTPELQVWRRSSNGSYRKVGSTPIEATVENSFGLVYEQPVEPPLPVMAGDVLGFFQPDEADSRLTLYQDSLNAAGMVLLNSTSSPASVVDSTAGQSQLNLPVVSAEVLTAPSPTTSQQPPTPTLSPSPPPISESSLSLAALIGIIAGVLVVVLVPLVVITALVLCQCYKKRKATCHLKAVDKIQAQDNQAYGRNSYGVRSVQADCDIAIQENQAYSSVAPVDNTYDVIDGTTSHSGSGDIPTAQNVCYDCGWAEEGGSGAWSGEEAHEYEEEEAIPTTQSASCDDDEHEYELLELT